jgi:hypothetical protein
LRLPQLNVLINSSIAGFSILAHNRVNAKKSTITVFIEEKKIDILFLSDFTLPTLKTICTRLSEIEEAIHPVATAVDSHAATERAAAS